MDAEKLFWLNTIGKLVEEHIGMSDLPHKLSEEGVKQIAVVAMDSNITQCVIGGTFSNAFLLNSIHVLAHQFSINEPSMKWYADVIERITSDALVVMKNKYMTEESSINES